jgi:hypothetical protein
MKKIIILLSIILASITANAQYKGIQVNEPVIYMDDTLSSCYIKIISVSIPSDLLSFIAMYTLTVFKTKEYATSHPNWVITVQEFSSSQQIQFSPEFTQGDLVQMISQELIYKLLELNPTWDEDNLIIDE